MSIDYNLSIKTELSSAELLNFVSKVDDFEWIEKSLLGFGLIIYSIPEDDLSQSIIEESYGFTPSVQMSFRLNSRSDYSLSKLTIVKITAKIMQQYLGDMVLLHNGETTVLHRLKNELSVNRDFGKWKESELAEIKLPYELKSLPSPLL